MLSLMVYKKHVEEKGNMITEVGLYIEGYK